jgi:hypothetical protein
MDAVCGPPTGLCSLASIRRLGRWLFIAVTGEWDLTRVVVVAFVGELLENALGE